MYVKDIELNKYVVGVEKTFGKNDYIIKEGSPFTGLFYIQKGMIKILKKDGRGRDLLMCFVTKGDIVGITTFFNDENYQFSAISLNNAALTFISPSEFEKLLNSSNELSKKMMEILIQRIHFLENWMTNVLNLSVDKRIAETLIYYSLSCDNIEHNIQENNDIVINYSIDEMVGLSGSTTSYVIKILQKFSKKGLIQKINQEKLLITDYAGLLQVANSTDTIEDLDRQVVASR